MPAILNYSEVTKDKKIAEDAIAKILTDLQDHTGILVHGITITKLISSDSKKIIISLNVSQ